MPVASAQSGDRDPIPEGSHPAICYAVVDLGTQQPLPNSQFNSGPARKVLLMWEIPGERIQVERDGEKLDLPRAISKEFTLSLGKKANLRKFLETWRSRKFTDDELKGFDLAKLLGLGCLLSIVHSDKGYANVDAVVKLPKGMPEMRAENELLVYDIDQPVPKKLPEWVRKKIEASDEHAGGGNSFREHEPPPFPDDDDIPF